MFYTILIILRSKNLFDQKIPKKLFEDTTKPYNPK